MRVLRVSSLRRQVSGLRRSLHFRSFKQPSRWLARFTCECERESLVTVLFRAVGTGTELDFRHEQLFDETVRDNHRRGWTESLAKLETFLQD